MRVLVSGSSGQLARSLVAAKKPPGVELTALGRPEFDLAAPETIPRTLDRLAPDVLVNAAAYTAVDGAESVPNLAHAINAEGAAHVAQACHRRDIPIIHISSDYVFDGAKSTPYQEDDCTGPLGVYGRTKLCGERLVAAACKQHIILRTSWLVSPYGQNFVKTMLTLAKGQSEICVVDDQLGAPTFAMHLATGILAIAQRIVGDSGTVAPWGVYHAAGTGEATWCGLAREIFLQSVRLEGPSASVRPIATAEYPTQARRPANSRLNCEKVFRAFGVRLPDWRIGIAECVVLLTPGRDQDAQEINNRGVS